MFLIWAGFLKFSLSFEASVSLMGHDCCSVRLDYLSWSPSPGFGYVRRFTALQFGQRGVGCPSSEPFSWAICVILVRFEVLENQGLLRYDAYVVRRGLTDVSKYRTSPTSVTTHPATRYHTPKGLNWK